MIEHQIEWLMSEAWGVSDEAHAQDFARRVDEYLEAQQFETGLGSLDLLPDIVREVYGRARTPKIPWKDLFRECLEKAVGTDGFPTPRAWAQVAGNKPEDGVITPILPKPLVNRFIAIGPDTSGIYSPEELEGMFGDPGNPPEGEPTRSDIIKDICDRAGIETIEVKRSHVDPDDLRGIPIINKKDETVEWHLPEGIEEMGHHRKMVFLDEYVLADPAKIKAINAIKLERDNGDQSERND